MAKEYEIISKSQFRHLNVFLVRLFSRTPHVHGEIELGVLLDGHLTLSCGTKNYALQKDDIYLINSLDVHEFSAGRKGALILSIQLSPRSMESFLTEPFSILFQGSPRLRDHYSGKQAQFALLRMLCVELAYAYLGRKDGRACKCYSLMALLLYHLKRYVPNRELSKQDYLPMQQKNDRLLSITNYIEENFTQKLLLEEIAQQQGVSMYYLSHLIKEALGVSFQEYVKRLRFEYACNLLATTDRKILDISISSGFSDARYLTKLFQEHFGCTPKEYRKATAVPKEKTMSVIQSTQYLFDQQESYLLLTPIRDQMRAAFGPLSLDDLWA